MRQNGFVHGAIIFANRVSGRNHKVVAERLIEIGPDTILNIQTKYEFLDEPDFEADTFELTVFRTRIASDILEYGIGGGVELHEDAEEGTPPFRAGIDDHLTILLDAGIHVHDGLFRLGSGTAAVV